MIYVKDSLSRNRIFGKYGRGDPARTVSLCILRFFMSHTAEASTRATQSLPDMSEPRSAMLGLHRQSIRLR